MCSLTIGPQQALSLSIGTQLSFLYYQQGFFLSSLLHILSLLPHTLRWGSIHEPDPIILYTWQAFIYLFLNYLGIEYVKEMFYHRANSQPLFNLHVLGHGTFFRKSSKHRSTPCTETRYSHIYSPDAIKMAHKPLPSTRSGSAWVH